MCTNIRRLLASGLTLFFALGCDGSPTPAPISKPASRPASPVVEMPACEGSADKRTLTTTPPAALPSCESLSGSGEQGTTTPIEKLAVVYDALPLKGRSWFSFAGYPAAWGRPSVQWVPAEAKVGGLDTPASFCRPIQSFGGASDPGWKADSCDRPAGAGSAKDTRADAAIAGLCRTLIEVSPPFDAAVLVFDHIIDSPATGEDAAANFANAVVACGESGLVMRLVAQPSTHRYAYIIGKSGTGAALHAISARFAELLEASSAHTKSPNAIFKSDRGACPKGICPHAYDMAISASFGVTRGSSVTATRAQPNWSKPDPALPAPVRDARRKLPPALRPDAFTTQCGDDIAVTANSSRPMSDAAGLGAIGLTWSAPLGEPRVQDDYPYLQERLLVEMSVAKTARTAISDINLTTEAVWTSRFSVSEAAGKSTSLSSGAEPAASSPCAAAAGVSITPILRVDATSLELIYWRSRSGDGAAASKLNSAFPLSTRRSAFDPAAAISPGERFGWLTSASVGRDVAQLNLEVNSSPLELDCITSTMVQTLSSVVSFEQDDFDAWLCADERKEHCASLGAVCDSAPTQPKMGIFFKDLMGAPAVRFGGSNRRAPDSARAASLSVARVFAAVSESLKQSRPEAGACSNARVSVGCADTKPPNSAGKSAPPPGVAVVKPRAGSGSGEVARSGSGSGSDELRQQGSGGK